MDAAIKPINPSERRPIQDSLDIPWQATTDGQHSNIRKTDIIFMLKPKAGGAENSHGLIDKRLFTGGNKLHAIMDVQTCLWRLKYDQGIIPPVLQQQFTSFGKLQSFVKNYFDNRNVEIVEIID